MARKGKKRGPKGGIKHTPGRGHDRKSKPQKSKDFHKRAKQKREERLAEAARQWQEWDSYSEFEKRIRPEKKPIDPRPENPTD